MVLNQQVPADVLAWFKISRFLRMFKHGFKSAGFCGCFSMVLNQQVPADILAWF